VAGAHPPDITRLLRAWRAGDDAARDELIPLVYEELRALAARYFSREAAPHTLQPTALVNEAYLRLAGNPDVNWQDRGHFFAIASRIMRHVLVDQARQRGRQKRGGSATPLQLGTHDPEAPEARDLVDALALDRALTQLESLDSHQGRIVELRFYGGLTIEETADVLGVSTGTVKRGWGVARAWLYRELTRETPPAREGPADD
jgi:RNA polymerase sigma-70 factor, ECF subfamily